ncbi:hypothetical protein POM88_038381 [Heracleum sosnowskyi]|uniref:Uncharacterized protein n=1 Tax=Heracleum sosnowskyi TaxID=360622 RepID=A0AAD8M5E9_9APIA|nr:hypothetical protein POM88_038381 [Heracleum sosnowskyi]
MKEKCDVLVANDASLAQGWIVDGGDDDEKPSLDSNIISEELVKLPEGSFENLMKKTFNWMIKGRLPAYEYSVCRNYPFKFDFKDLTDGQYAEKLDEIRGKYDVFDGDRRFRICLIEAAG